MATSTIKKAVPTGFGTKNYDVFYAQGDTWTAPGNGIVIARTSWNTTHGTGYVYMFDNTDQVYVAAFNTADTSGLSATSSFPAISGHQYVISAYANADYMEMYFYPFV